MTYFGGQIIPAGSTTIRVISTISRYHSDLKWAESVQYDRHGRGKVLNYIRSTAAGRLVSEVPRAGFVGPSGAEAASGDPVWIWDCDVEEKE